VAHCIGDGRRLTCIGGGKEGFCKHHEVNEVYFLEEWGCKGFSFDLGSIMLSFFDWEKGNNSLAALHD
jgi:hypothetical protein